MSGVRQGRIIRCPSPDPKDECEDRALLTKASLPPDPSLRSSSSMRWLPLALHFFFYLPFTDEGRSPAPRGPRTRPACLTPCVLVKPGNAPVSCSQNAPRQVVGHTDVERAAPCSRGCRRRRTWPATISRPRPEVLQELGPRVRGDEREFGMVAPASRPAAGRVRHSLRPSRTSLNPPLNAGFSPRFSAPPYGPLANEGTPPPPFVFSPP